MKKILSLLALALFAVGANAQVTPISVGAGGLAPIPFNTMPTLAEGWSRTNVGAAASTITTVAAMDTAVGTLTAAGIVTALSNDPSVTNATTMFGGTVLPSTTSMNWRWNASGLFLGSRPTGNDYNVLMVTLVNNSGGGQATVVLKYDYGLDLVGVTTAEDDNANNGGLGGLRAYYSLTGLANSWVHMPEFDYHGNSQYYTNYSVTVTLASTWANGANLYIIWTDDNAQSGSTGTTTPVEGPNAIDNFALDFGVCVNPSIDTQPHPTTVVHCRDTNLTVVATGSGVTYQWYKDNSGNPIGGATSATYSIPNAQPTAAGTYWVIVTGACGTPQESTHVTLSVDQDSTPPTVVSALVHCLDPDPNQPSVIEINFSERMDASSAGTPDYYQTSALDGGTDWAGASVVIRNGTNVLVTLAGALTPNKNYSLTIDPNVADCPGNPIDSSPVTAALHYEVCLLTTSGQLWKLNSEGVDLGTDWRTDGGYDDSEANFWTNSLTVMDGKTGTSGVRTNFMGSNYINGEIIRTALPINNANFPTDRIPTYYLRAHFDMPTAANKIIAERFRTFEDDYTTLWLNNEPEPAFVSPPVGAVTNETIFGYSGGTAVGDGNYLPSINGSYNSNLLAHIKYGDNLACAMLFNNTTGSSDITFAYDLRLIISGYAVPVTLHIVDNGTTVHVTWDDTTVNLYQANTVDATGGSWTQVVSGGGVTIAAGTATIPHNQRARFYTLRR